MDSVQSFVNDLLAASNRAVERVSRWQQANQAALDQTLRQIREPAEHLNTWVAANRAPILRVVEQLQQFQQFGDAACEEWDQTGLGYLVAPLDLGEQLVLAFHAAPGDSEALMDFVEDALTQPGLIERVCTALDEASVLSDSSRDHLKHGLRHLQHREAIHAWPPLIIGLEGAFVDVAIAENHAVRRGNHVYLAGPEGLPQSRKIPSVEGVAKALGHGREQSDFGDFLSRQVYGGEGNPFRHGTAQEGVREHAICLAIAVIGWLDVFVVPGSREIVHEAIRDELERRDL